MNFSTSFAPGTAYLCGLDKGPICPLHLLGELGSVCGDGWSWVGTSSGGAGEVKWDEEKKCQTWFKCVHDDGDPPTGTLLAACVHPVLNMGLGMARRRWTCIGPRRT
jgi:hypothetical protein